MNQTNLTSFHIKRIDLLVSNLHRSLAFYQNVLGFTVKEQEKSTALLGTPGNTGLIYLQEDIHAEQPAAGMTGLYHFAILVPSRKDLASFLQQMIYQNEPLIGASDHHFSEAIYLEDPDGIGIEVYADREKESWRELNGELPIAADPLDAKDLLSHAAKWNGFPHGTTIGHLHFHVSTLAEARSFYVDAIGLAPTIEVGRQLLFVSAAGYHHHIGLNTWKGEGAVPAGERTIGLKKVYVQTSAEDIEHLTAQGAINAETGQARDPFHINYQFLK
ncbi:VOC family protein [Sediminibacillus albus]|uniref:Catechol 2,3-dioxygenase n=1 Tax=Sediminibacillus albus TaxID=407036 RepID=A0A1G8ZQC9_9BACI|nr:VOC family protein [Sediminibacillus albus]SDK17309.1 catechol 2,3-dioxygenase [Sediminibacillus albus]